MPRLPLLLLVPLVGCTPAELTPWPGLEPGADPLLPGSDGGWDVAYYETTYRVRGDRSVTTEVMVPMSGDEVATGPFPAVLLVQGGAVTVDRYRWLAAHMASRGFVVFSPHHLWNLALFQTGNGLDTLDAARRLAKEGDTFLPLDPNLPGLAVGHSLGGVAASSAWLDPDLVRNLVLFASTPNPNDDLSVREGLSGRVMSVTGSADGLISPQTVVESAAVFPVDTRVAMVEGMNHFQFTDDPSSKDLEKEPVPTVDTREGRRLAQFLLDVALAEVAGEDITPWLDTNTWPTGLTPIITYHGDTP